MEKKRLGQILMILGIIVVLVAALADPLGLGRSPGFGWRQAVVFIIGVLAIWLGFRWRRS